jgi:carboxypeptidase C (cathepsin A)
MDQGTGLIHEPLVPLLMKAILLANALPLRLLLLVSVLIGATGLTSCTTTDPSTDTIVYPTAAEKNQQMQESMSESTRTLQ